MENRLQEMRMEKGWTQPQVSALLKRIDSRIDVGMVSRYEKGVCLPTDGQLREFEAVYGIARTELYKAEDLDLLGLIPAAVSEKGPTEESEKVQKMPPPSHMGRYRKCYRISREFAASLPDDLLQTCGYSSWQSWHDACLKRLLGEYAARKKAEKREAG